MATSAKMSFNCYPNGKYGSLGQQSGKESEVTQDMHLKMSKKIAQLTKVIYSLNTKNDDHEAVVQEVRDRCEEDKQQLLADTRMRIIAYETKINKETELHYKVQSLEQCLRDYEQQKQRAFEEFELFQRTSTERESCLREEQSDRLLAVSQDVLNIKQNFEEQLRKFEDIKESLLLTRNREVEDLLEKHKNELERTRHVHSSHNSDIEQQNLQLQQIHQSELAKLYEEIEKLKNDKLKGGEEYDLKLNKAQAFFDKELSVLRLSKDSEHFAEVIELRQVIDKMTRDNSFQEKQYQQRIDSLIAQLSLREKELADYEEKLMLLKKSLSNYNSCSDNLMTQLDESRQETAECQSSLRQTQAELIVVKQVSADQARDLLAKSTLIGELEATKLQHESTISDLQSQVGKLRDKLNWLESERHDVERDRYSDSEKQRNQLRSLEKALENLSAEKQAQKEHHDQAMMAIQLETTEREKQLLADHYTKLAELDTQHTETLSEEHRQAEATLQALRQELEQRLSDETKRLAEERDAIAAEFERVKSELFIKLRSAEEQISELEVSVRESEQGLGSASTQMNNLRDASARLKSELDSTRVELKTVKIRLASVQAELDKQKLLHNAAMKEAEVKLKTRTDQITTELEQKWSNTLRLECIKLRQTIIDQKEDEKNAAIKKLTSLKDEELSAMKKGWEKKVQELLTQISELRLSLDSRDSESSSALHSLRLEMEQETRRLETALTDATDAYSEKVTLLEKSFAEQMRIIDEKHSKEKQRLEHELKSEHMEEIQAQIVAHKATIHSVKEEAAHTRLTEITHLKDKHSHEQDELRGELRQLFNSELEKQNKSHQNQLHAARMELERAMEINKQKERDYSTRIEELQSEVGHRERHIRNNEDDNRRLREKIEALCRDIDFQSKEILRIRGEAKQHIMLCEEDLKHDHNRKMDDLAADHLRETQDMLSEFNQAQHMLKVKILELEELLVIAEERYQSRDSRPEDLDMISHLRESVQERELRMKQLIDEKRYYQLELVNRETNFNKVFNNSPHVGVLNPMSKKKKGDKDRIPVKNQSTPTLYSVGSQSKLDPLPGSPMHDEKLNPSRPLPQPLFTKKFVN